jgi:tetratricopeptide (TPR) repeat protein
MEPRSSFHFTSTKSFQLFTQGLESLQAYERSANSVTLAAAERKFEECIGQFPKDLLPRFYYGVVKTLTGYDGLDEAIRQFNLILKSNADDLRPDTLYNLAVAHLEKYKPKDRQMALELFEKTIEAIQTKTREEIEKKTKEETEKKIQGKVEKKTKEEIERETREEIEKGPREPKLESLRLQTLILEHYLFVEDNLWEHREDERPAENCFEEAKKRLQNFLTDYESTQILEAARADLVADYNNVQGTYLESCAYFAQKDQRKVVAMQAATAFEQALQAKQNWIPAKSNLARVYQDLLDDFETAQRLWQEVLETRPRDEYAFYMLGRLYHRRGETMRAIASYRKAPHIPEASLNLTLLYLELGDVARARISVQKVIEADDVRPRTKRSAEEALRKIQTLESSTPASS